MELGHLTDRVSSFGFQEGSIRFLSDLCCFVRIRGLFVVVGHPGTRLGWHEEIPNPKLLGEIALKQLR